MSDDDVRIRCEAMTQAGRQCKNNALPGERFCHVHVKEAERETAVPPEATAKEELTELVEELDQLIAELKKSVPEQAGDDYTPVRMLRMLRENVHQFTPEMRLGILESFEGTTVEDWLDPETWKGMAYMLGYSARSQADVWRQRMNDNLPDPFKPDTVLRFMKKNLDKYTPDVAKDIMANFEGATPEDFLDPDTWKGVWYMLDYSIRFRAEQMKQKMAGETESDS